MKLITIVVEVDETDHDPTDDTGLTESAHERVSLALASAVESVVNIGPGDQRAF